MLNILDGLSPDLLALDVYLEDVGKRRLDLGAGQDSWKLERQQHFSEPAEPSWVAFSQGRWEESLRLLEADRGSFEDYCREAADHGVTLYRVRIVEEPIIPYLWWELHCLRIAVESGEKIRVVSPERIGQFEENGPLPELLTAGTDTVYRILYTDDGVPDSALRFVNHEATKQCVEFIQGLYEVGEELNTFFERKVAHMPPPRIE